MYRATRSRLWLRLRFQLIQVFYFSSTQSIRMDWQSKLNKGLFFQTVLSPKTWDGVPPCQVKYSFQRKGRFYLTRFIKKRMWRARGLTVFPSSPLLINKGLGFMFSHSYFYDNPVHTYRLYQALTNKLKSPYGNRAEGDLEGDGMVHA